MKMSTKRLRSLVREELARSTKLLREDEEQAAFDAELAAAEAAGELDDVSVETDIEEVEVTDVSDRDLSRAIRRFWVNSIPEENRHWKWGADVATWQPLPCRVILTVNEWTTDDGSQNSYVDARVYRLILDGAGGVAQGEELLDVADNMIELMMGERLEGSGDVWRRMQDWLGEDWENVWAMIVQSEEPLSRDMDALALTDLEQYQEIYLSIRNSPLFKGLF
jgi:hypothetical protein